MSWRLLFVDDVAEDVELATLELGGWEQPWVAERADTEPKLRAALAAFRPHVVLCDLHLPGFDSEEARAIVREQAPDAVFVFLTGAAAEIAESADAPVWDKNRLSRLPAQLQDLIEQTPAWAARPEAADQDDRPAAAQAD